MNEKNKKTFWPYGILLAIFAIIVACIVTVIISLDYPVYKDNFYFDQYQDVDNNYNEIQISQAKFDEKYAVEFIPENAKVGQNFNAKFKITSKDGLNLKDLKAQILFTRPDSSKFDKKFEAKLKDNTFEANFIPGKPGRWQILVKITDTKDTGFFKFEIKVDK